MRDNTFDLTNYEARTVEAQTIRLHEHPDFPGLKVMTCPKLSAVLTPTACATNAARAERHSACWKCPTGMLNRSLHEIGYKPSAARQFHAGADSKVGLSCIRCGRSERDATKYIAKFRLIDNGCLCPNCWNRGKEVERGVNSKQAAPKKWAFLKAARAVVQHPDGRREALDIGLRAGRLECERWVQRVMPGCLLVSATLDGRDTTHGEPEHDLSSKHWKRQHESKA